MGGIAPRREADAFLDELADVPPNAVTACAGWTAHELVAHLVSGVEAIASQAEAHLDGREIPEFGSFAEREVGFWGIDDDELRRRLADGEQRMTAGLHVVRAHGGDAPVPGIGWGMAIEDVELHLRQEFAVHRWDLVGDDDVGDELLGRPELLDHSARILADSLLGPGRSRDPVARRAVLGPNPATGLSDLLIAVDGTGARLDLVDPTDEAADIECDAAARLLWLWGRRPAPARRVRTTLDASHLARLELILSGF